MKTPTTWILVADGARARVIESNGPGAPLSVVKTFGNDDGRTKTEDLMTDKPGRVGESAKPNQQHGYEPRTDAHEQAEIEFLTEVAVDVNSAALAGKFDRLAVVAPPQALGRLRNALDSHASQRIVAELNKDLTKFSDDDIRERVQDEALV